MTETLNLTDQQRPLELLPMAQEATLTTADVFAEVQRVEGAEYELANGKKIGLVHERDEVLLTFLEQPSLNIAHEVLGHILPYNSGRDYDDPSGLFHGWYQYPTAQQFNAVKKALSSGTPLQFEGGTPQELPWYDYAVKFDQGIIPVAEGQETGPRSDDDIEIIDHDKRPTTHLLGWLLEPDSLARLTKLSAGKAVEQQASYPPDANPQKSPAYYFADGADNYSASLSSYFANHLGLKNSGGLSLDYYARQAHRTFSNMMRNLGLDNIPSFEAFRGELEVQVVAFKQLLDATKYGAAQHPEELARVA